MLILTMAWVVLLGMLSFNSLECEDHTKMGASELGEGTLLLTSYISSHKFAIFFSTRRLSDRRFLDFAVFTQFHISQA